MDTNMRDESRDRRREEALARRLGEALDRAAPQGTEQCPDAELIAAYHERALGPEEKAQCEVHFAACPRCRKILAVLAASADTPLAEKEVARLGELSAAVRAPREEASQTAKPVRPSRLDWRARWLAPALGVAAVLAVWFAMRPPWHTTDQSSSEPLIAQAPKNEPAPNAEAPALDQFSHAAPAKKVKKDSAPSVVLKDQSVSKAESAKPAAEALAKNRLDSGAVGGISPSAGVGESASGNEKKEKAEVNSAVGGAPPPAPAPPAAAMRRPLAQAQPNAAGRAAPSAPEVPASTTQSVTVTGEAPMVATADASAGNAPARDNQALAGQRRDANLPLKGRNSQSIAVLDAARETAVQIRTPSEKVSWRVGKNGRIERSTDAGRTWTLQTSPIQQEWLAGAAVSDTICWIVGRNGAIARTADGERWERITPPTQAAAFGKLPDWTGITARGATNATVTAGDGRRYTTQDGGKTWQAQ